VDDGGSDVVAYQVAWFDATTLAAYVPEVQTIKLSATVSTPTRQHHPWTHSRLTVCFLVLCV